MRLRTWTLAGLALAAAAAAPAPAQRLTEQFIPFGQSPGVSGVSSLIGVVTAVDARNGVVTIYVEGGPMTFILGPATDVWLDRSEEGETALDVGAPGVQLGDVVELKLGEPEVVAASANAAPSAVADWIKIEGAARE